MKKPSLKAKMHAVRTNSLSSTAPQPNTTPTLQHSNKKSLKFSPSELNLDFGYASLLER